MYKLSICFVAALILLGSCHKLDADDILHTDTYGNVISRGNESNDWKPATVVGNADRLDYVRIMQMSVDQDVEAHGYRPFLIKKNCTTIPDTLEIYPFANPLHNTQDLMIRLKSSVPICFFSYSYEGYKKYDGGGGAIGWMTQNWTEGKKQIDLSLAGSVLLPTGSMKLNVYVVTVDSCAYTASGSVLVN